MNVYVASSWRNLYQPVVVDEVRLAGHEPYDFRHPEWQDNGFRWTDVMLSPDDNGLVNEWDFLLALTHSLAAKGFKSDFDALQKADACVLVLPCGRSAHLELGYAVGNGTPTAILLDGPMVTPELMYKMVDFIATSTKEIIEWLDTLP